MGSTRENVLKLAPSIAKQAEKIELDRAVPADLVESLREAGCFRMLVPRSHDGDELELAETVEVLQILAAADASTAWNVMVASETPCLAARLTRPVFDETYAATPDVLGAGAVAPKGEARVVDGGYVVNGRWGFVSGCERATWIAGNCFVMDDDGLRFDASGMPEMRMVVAPADRWERLDTWHTSGMRGTGSHDVVLTDENVATDHAFEIFGTEVCHDSPTFKIPVLSLFSLHVAAVALGIARGALDDIATIATSKRSTLTLEILAQEKGFQTRLGEAETALTAAQSLLADDVALAWRAACETGTLTEEEKLRIRADGTWMVRTARTVTAAAFELGGGRSIYESCSLQRRNRDVQALCQHALLTDGTYTNRGAQAVGQSAGPV